MLNSMDQLIREYRMLPPGTTVLCALSGGADSVCLFHRLCQLREPLGFRLAAAHYNHTLRGEESERDEAFVEEIVTSFVPDGSVLLLKSRGDVSARARETGRGLEETAREMRYAFLREAAKQVGAEVIATAHNLNDQAETLLMHLVRGSGLRGLCGMEPVRGDVIRPLLTTSRAEIETYLINNGLSWVEDSSNGEDTYTRNRIRHQVLPVLEEICPGATDRMSQCAQSLRKDEEYLSQQGARLAEQAVWREDELVIPVSELALAHDAVAIRAVRQLLGQYNQGNDNCTMVHLKGLLDLCRSEDPSGELDLPDGLKAVREYEFLVLTRQNAPRLEEQPWTLPGAVESGGWRLECQETVYQGEFHTGTCFFLKREGVEKIQLRSRQTGDRLKRPGRSGKTIKKLLIEEKIPLRYRESLPVLEVLDQVAAVAGVGPDIAFLPQVGERAWRIECVPLNQWSV